MQQLFVGAVVLGSLVLVAGIAVAIHALRKAPDGYEDSKGFHVTEEAQVPATSGEAAYYS